MRISTSQLYQRPTLMMQDLTRQADTLQMQVATGKRFTAPSGDSTAWVRLEGLKRADAGEKADAANITLASQLLAESDSALDSIETQLQRAKELATQAATGTYSDADRAAIAENLDAILDDLYALANSKDVRGQPLFGGATGDVAYTRAPDGTIAFAGTGEPAAIPIGESTEIRATDRGDRVFGDLFGEIPTLSAALKAGGAAGQAAANTAMTQLDAAMDRVGSARASVGARGARLDLEAGRLEYLASAREETRIGIEEVDPATTIAELQKTLTILQATQASFTKLTGLSLFDYLR